MIKKNLLLKFQKLKWKRKKSLSKRIIKLVNNAGIIRKLKPYSWYDFFSTLDNMGSFSHFSCETRFELPPKVKNFTYRCRVNFAKPVYGKFSSLRLPLDLNSLLKVNSHTLVKLYRYNFKYINIVKLLKIKK